MVLFVYVCLRTFLSLFLLNTLKKFLCFLVFSVNRMILILLLSIGIVWSNGVRGVPFASGEYERLSTVLTDLGELFCRTLW